MMTRTLLEDCRHRIANDAMARGQEHDPLIDRIDAALAEPEVAEGAHTPGPWMVDSDRPYDILRDDRDGHGCTPIIASVHVDNCVDGSWRADAHLIAEAPAMSAALELTLIWLRAALDCKEWHWDADQREAAEEAYLSGSDAIAKAKGGAS